jgi:hypothetical protein
MGLPHTNQCEPTCFLIGESLPKIKNLKAKWKNYVILEVFNHQKWEKKNSKTCEISILGFQCVAKI